MHDIQVGENSALFIGHWRGRLLRIAGAQLERFDPLAAVRGHRVVGSNQREIGYVRALIVDEITPRIHFLEVAFGGVLGLGETTSFVPVELVTRIDADAVFINQTREHLARAPHFDPEVRALSAVDVDLIRNYYGCSPLGQLQAPGQPNQLKRSTEWNQ